FITGRFYTQYKHESQKNDSSNLLPGRRNARRERSAKSRRRLNDITLDHHLAKLRDESLHLSSGSDCDAQKVWQGRKDSTNLDFALSQSRNDGPRGTLEVDHQEVCMRGNVSQIQFFQLVINVFPDITIPL